MSRSFDDVQAETPYLAPPQQAMLRVPGNCDLRIDRQQLGLRLEVWCLRCRLMRGMASL